MKPDAAQVVAEAALDAVVAAFASASVSLPDRQFWTYGQIVGDCEQLAVSVERIYAVEGDPSVQTSISLAPRAGFAMRAAVLAVQILRCVPTSDDRGNPPSPADLADDAAVATADCAYVLNALVAAVKARDLPGCSSVVLDSWEPVRSGGLGGGTTRLRVGLGG